MQVFSIQHPDSLCRSILVTARQRSCGKVMSSVVCVCSQSGPSVTTTHEAIGQSQITLDAAPPPDMFKLVHLETPLLRPLEVFKRVHLGTQPPAPILPPDVFKLVHYVALTSVRKRAVGIPLKCLLVLI